MKKIETVGVVGAGTMGAALAQKFATEGFKVVLLDRERRFLEKGLKSIQTTLQEGVERKLFSEEQVAGILSKIRGSVQPADLRYCELVIEAIFEDFAAKTSLLRELSEILPKETIVGSNTSSFSISELAQSISYPQRFLGLHYFYHAAKNRLVEIVPGEKTAPETRRACEIFSALSGKDPIVCKDRYGFAVNRFFVPWLNEAVRLLEEGVGDAATIDRVSMKTFQIGMGPFALMNATGVRIAYHAQKTLEAFGNFYRVAALLKKQAMANEPWGIEAAANVPIEAETEKQIRERMLGSVFLVCSQILDEEVCAAVDLNRGARIGLRWRKGPLELMQSSGEEEVRRLIRQIAGRYQTPLPRSIGAQFWKMEFVRLEKQGHSAFITIHRPEDLNALNEQVMQELSEKFAAAEADPAIDTIAITGAGKAFVAGADIKFFVQNMQQNALEKIVAFTRSGQEVYQRIERSAKKIVALINGMALGGGLELALCADVILATPEASMAFPETGIGIYPGLGGTQRTPKRIGRGLAKFLIYTGKMLSAREAEEMGLVDAIIPREDIFALKFGEKVFPVLQNAEKVLPRRWETLGNFFEKNSLARIVNNEGVESQLAAEEVEKLRKRILQKAPIALQVAEKLIDAAAGCQSELDEIPYIFSTEDALLGLSSMGKEVRFTGRPAVSAR